MSMPKSIWLKILSGVYHCDLRPIGSGVSVFEVSEAYQARYGFFFFFFFYSFKDNSRCELFKKHTTSKKSRLMF